MSDKKPAVANQRAHYHKRGVALVMVLSCLVFIAMLVLVFLSMARTEQQSSAAFSESTQVRNLTEVPINLVVGQIRKATEQIGGQQSWASQPGMIRVYGVENDESNVRSKPTAIYKLYSDESMVLANADATHRDKGLSRAQVRDALSSDVTELRGWQSLPGLYTDLNEPLPVMDSDGVTPEWEFPIMDPRGMVAGTDAQAVAGFSLGASAGQMGNVMPTGTVAPVNRMDKATRVPMPVKWLYVLQDGQVIPPASANATGVVSFTGVVPTPENPIVGRVAFWTDDESSKVNINTACEGTYWQSPHTTSKRDREYASRMPARNEFTRYPGHPAQTSLSPVFQAFGPEFSISSSLSESVLADRLKKYHDISPRYPWGGTMGGTIRASAPISLSDKTDRLYASLDELLYNKDRALNDSQLDGRDLAIGKFFLTTNSRSPELTLFNKPKVMLWPVSRLNTHRNPMDKLMVMLGNTGVEGGTNRSEGWYFQRYENAEILSGVVGSGHTTWEDFRKGTRNESVFSTYIPFALGQDPGVPTSDPLHSAQLFPGFGGGPDKDNWTNASGSNASNYKGKYGTGKRDQILTEIMDLMRWGLNTENTSGTPSYQYLPPHKDMTTNPSRRAESSAAPLMTFATWPRAATGLPDQLTGLPVKDVSNSYIKETKGFGRFPTLSEITLVFMARDARTTEILPDGNKRPTNIASWLVVEPFHPSVGPPPWTANWRYRVLFEDMNGRTDDPATPANEAAGWPQPPGSPNNPNFRVRMIKADGTMGQWRDLLFAPPRSGGTDNGAWKTTASFKDIRDNWPVSMVNFPIDRFQPSGNTTAFPGLLTQFRAAQGASSEGIGKTGSKTFGNFQVGNSTQHATHYPFYSENVPTSTGDREFEFSGGTMTIAMYLGWTGYQTGQAGGDKHLPVQKIRVYFPPCRMKLPSLTDGDWALQYHTLAARWSQATPDAANAAVTMRDALIRQGDITRSVEVNANGPAKGDLRFYSALPEVPLVMKTDGTQDLVNSYFVPSPNYYNSVVRQDHGLRDGAWIRDNEPQIGYNSSGTSRMTTRDTAGRLLKDVNYPDYAIPSVTRGVNGAFNKEGRAGDWDTGIGSLEDGPYLNKPDEGIGALPQGGYFSRGGEFAKPDNITFSPNRMITSAIAFGSLPTGIHAVVSYPTRPDAGRADFYTSLSGGTTYSDKPWAHPHPWQTLLFCPNPASRQTAASTPDSVTKQDHWGFKSPKDHLLLDLFWMPIVEPYAISDGASTAGKINMNHQLMPFTYINRSTGIHAAMKSTMVTAIPVSEVGSYKTPSGTDLEFKYNVNVDATLTGFQQRFDNFDIFRAPSEICEIYLVPKRIEGANYGGAAAAPTSYADMNSWWNGQPGSADAMDLTGDNLREAPYNSLYPRLTTQSNTFTIHYRVQMLRKARSTAPATWEEGKDAVTAEYRGSTMLERYLDANEQELGSIGLGNKLFLNSFDSAFRFRVIQRKQFAP